MSAHDQSASVNFFIHGVANQWAYRRMYHVPRVGDLCVFHDKRYTVLRIEWCLDTDATDVGVRVNVELSAPKRAKKAKPKDTTHGE